MLDPKNLKNGESQHEEYLSAVSKTKLFQYDYRHTNGKLFSAVQHTLKDCIVKRNQWIAEEQFKECLDQWSDLPERVYSKAYKSKFDVWVNNYINTRPNAGAIDIQNAVTSCLHHETGNKTPYIEFNENEDQEEEESI